MNLIGLLITKIAGPANAFVLLFVAYRALHATEAAEFVAAYALLPVFFILADFGIRLILPVRCAHASITKRISMFRQSARKQLIGRTIVVVAAFTYIQLFFETISSTTAIFLALYAAFVHVADIAGHFLKGLRQSAYEAGLVTAQIVISSLLLLAAYFTEILSSWLAAVLLAFPAMLRSFFAYYRVNEILNATNEDNTQDTLVVHEENSKTIMPVLELGLGVIFARLPIIFCTIYQTDQLDLVEVTIIIMILQFAELASSILSMNSLTMQESMLRPGDLKVLGFKTFVSQMRNKLLPLLATVVVLAISFTWIEQLINPSLQSTQFNSAILLLAYVLYFSHFSRYLLLGREQVLSSIVNLSIVLVFSLLLIYLFSIVIDSIVNAVAMGFLLSHLVLLCLNLRALGRPLV